MTVETEVAALTTSVDALTSAVNVKKATLDASVSSAASSVTSALAHKDATNTLKTETTAIKDAAVTASSSAATAAASAYQDLASVSQEKAITATDVFVYDTSKDSDGGAWRNRTQGTSWYNEALNTSSRGATKKFPAVAVIVLEGSRLTIYDADDPSMPMWMVFSTGSDNSTGVTLYKMMVTGNLKAVTMKNGLLCVGRSSLVAVDFVADRAVYGNLTYVGDFSGHTIAQRNEYGVINNNNNWLFTGFTVQPPFNDVAITVLPNAPIDPDTGLPVPTIALAGDYGISVIKDDGSIVDITGQPQAITQIEFAKDNRIITQRGYGSELFILDIPESDRSYLPDYSQNDLQYYPSTNASATTTRIFTGSFTGLADTGEDIKMSSGAGLCHLHTANNVDNSLVAYTTPDYSTGWMVGDIKLATLMDTTAETVSATDLITNGDFSGGSSNWTEANGTTDNGTPSVAFDNTKVTLNGYAYPSHATVKQAITTEVGKTYRISFNCLVDNQAFVIAMNSSHASIGTHSINTGVQSVEFTASTTTSYVVLRSQASTGAASEFDDISVTEVVADRSHNSNGLNIVGNVNKSAVATGAELMAYGAFATANHLKQDYNSDLDFGTGDFSFLTWFKGTDAYGVFAGTNATVSTGFNVSTTGTIPSVQYRVHCGSEHTDAPDSTLIYNDTWNQLVVARKEGVLSIYENGVLLHSATNTGNITGGGSLAVGYRQYDNAQNYGGKLALLRISATAPTAEQVAKIYRDEKPLFQEGAQCTIYGEQKVLQAMAFDETTKLIHVGTTAASGVRGQSIFDGLERVDYKHNQNVAVALSAANGLVVEE